MDKKNWDNQRHLIPITFGVTGHRDILEEDLNRATKAIQRTIKHYRRQFPLSPFVFISPLAQGADSHAAKAALEADSNLFLQVVLPFSEFDYLQSIDIEHQPLFHELKNHLKTIGVITLKEEKLNTKADIDQAYADVGEFVALHSHLLFALTNGDNSIPKKGGTQEIVKYRERGCTNLLDTKSSNLRSSEQGILYKIKVRRSTDPFRPIFTNDDDEFFITPKVNDDPHAQSNEAKLAVGIDQGDSPSWLKREWYKLQGKHLEADEIAANIEELNEHCDKLLEENPEVLNQEKYITGMMHSLTDKLAGEYQNNYSFNVRLIFRISVLAVCLEGFEGIVEKSGILEHMPLLKYSFVTIVLLMWLFNRRSKNKELYQSYRAISEALRTQAHWIKAGINDEPADFFLISAIGEPTWIRRVVRTIWIIDYRYNKNWLINPESDTHLSDKPYEIGNHHHYSDKISNQLDQLEKEWIDNQVGYFKGKLKESDSLFEYIQSYFKGKITSSIIQLELFQGLQKIFFILFCILFVITNYLIVESIDIGDDFKEILGGFKTSFLLIAGLIGLYIRTKLFEQEVKKYQMCYTMFKHAKSSYEEIKRIEDISKNSTSKDVLLTPREVIIKKQNVFRNLGIAALDEGSIWYISNNETELENPTGG